jgi:hypothetical protein
VVVHLHNAWLSGVFLPLPAVPGIEVIVVATFHGVNEHFAGKPVRRALHRWMARAWSNMALRLTSVDGPNTAVAEQVFGLPASAFTVIPNGMPPPETAGAPDARAGCAAGAGPCGQHDSSERLADAGGGGGAA